MHARRLHCLLPVLVALVLARPAQATDTWSQPFTGVKRLHRDTGSQNINVLLIDLCAAGVSLRATASSERKRTVSSFGKLVGAQAAINGDFFSYSTYGTDGLAMSGGAAWPGGADHGYVAPVAIGAGKIEIDHHNNTTAVQGWMKEIVSGHPTLLDDGTLVGNPGDSLCTVQHPRTAIGITQDHRTMIWAVVDGRAPGRAGMTCPQLATLLLEFGAFDAVNMDGGGSSTMWLSSGVVNHPSDGAERTVANHLAVIAKGSGAAPHCPGPPPHPELTISLSLAAPAGQGGADPCTAGASKGIFDWWAASESEATVDVKNIGAAVAKNATVALWAEEPYVKIRRWEILSDWQAGGAFKINDTDGLQKNVPREAPGQSFKLWLASISPGETKRIRLVARAEKGSLADPVDHPDLRAWVAHVDDYYEKADFSAAPNNVDGLQKQTGGALRAFFQTDVLAPEVCDGKDNDCSGQADDGCSGPPPDGGATVTTDGSSGARRDGAADPRDQEGCSISTHPRGSVAALVLLALLALRRRRPGR